MARSVERADATLIALAKKEIQQIGLGAAEDVVDGCVIRQRKAYPVYDDTYQAHVNTVREALEQHCPNLHLVGRNGMHKYNNQDHAMMTAMLAAKNIAAGREGMMSGRSIRMANTTRRAAPANSAAAAPGAVKPHEALLASIHDDAGVTLNTNLTVLDTAHESPCPAES